MEYFYFINLDERGEFYADVRDDEENTIIEFGDAIRAETSNMHSMPELIQEGYVKHGTDLKSIEKYLKDLGLFRSNDTLVKA
jgi:hypothetical protein